MQKVYDALGTVILWSIETGEEYFGEIVTAAITATICYLMWG